MCRGCCAARWASSESSPELSIKVLPEAARRGNAAVGNAGAPGCGSLQSLGRTTTADFRGAPGMRARRGSGCRARSLLFGPRRAVIGGDRVFASLARKWWDALRHYTHPVFSDESVWRVSVPSTAPPLQLPFEPLIDWGGALALVFRRYERVRRARARACRRRYGNALARPRHGKQVSSAAAAVMEIHRRLKRSFDPDGIFNPGRLLAEL